jgi:hypothetical protein
MYYNYVFPGQFPTICMALCAAPEHGCAEIPCLTAIHSLVAGNDIQELGFFARCAAPPFAQTCLAARQQLASDWLLTNRTSAHFDE